MTGSTAALIEAGRDLGLGRVRTFVHVTLPLSRQPILTGLLITVLPMLGDYFTNQMLSGAASTSMIGNLIQGQLRTPGLEGQGAVLSLILLIVLLDPDDLLRDRDEPGGGQMTTRRRPDNARPERPSRLPWRNPWRPPLVP